MRTIFDGLPDALRLYFDRNGTPEDAGDGGSAEIAFGYGWMDGRTNVGRGTIVADRAAYDAGYEAGMRRRADVGAVTAPGDTLATVLAKLQHELMNRNPDAHCRLLERGDLPVREAMREFVDLLTAAAPAGYRFERRDGCYGYWLE